MEFDELEQAVYRLSKVVNEFPIGAVSLNDFKPTEEKVQMARKSLMHLNARLLMLRAKYKRMSLKLCSMRISTVTLKYLAYHIVEYMIDGKARRDKGEIGDSLQRAISDALINTKAIKLCLHSTTILSILSSKEGDTEDQKKLYAYMNKLFILNDSIISIQQSIEEASQIQLDLKMECQKALFDYKNFLKKQEEVRSKKLQEKYPEIVRNKTGVEKTLRKINIMKKLIRNFIAVSGYMLAKEPILLEALENHRELINIETIVKISQDSNDIDNM